MGAELFKKYVSSSIIVCFRSVVRHPVLVGMIVFVFSMYRLFPVLFSVLVSASPVIVSTFLLLGTLLSFGQPNIPEIEKEPESERVEIRKLESKVVGHTEVVGRDASFDFEATNGSRIEVEDDKVNDGDRLVNLVDDGLLELGEVKSEGGEEKVVLGSRYTPLRQSEDEHEHEHIVLESDKLWEGSPDPLNSNSGLLWKGVEGSGGGGDEDDDEDDHDDDDDDGDGSESGDSGSDAAESSSPDASMADIIPMLDELHPLLSEEQESHQPSHMSRDGTDAASEHSLESSDTSSESNDDTGIENRVNLKIGDDEDKESEHVDKEDDARSAITWTEDDQKNLMNLGTLELERNRHLEDLIARRRARDDTVIENRDIEIRDDEEDDKESEHVDKEDDTTSAIAWTEDDQKNLMNLGTSELERNWHLENLIARRRARDDTLGDDEDDDKESEHATSAITWTEDDQKNLMNLGTSEIERNRRLENLIARRRARKTMRMQAENYRIDLESADLPWNIPPISTSRNNPFDYDANDNIPGSAPSVLLQRRNPFDLPYDSSEEKPDLVGDTFQQEFAVFQPKEPFFRRHESFNVGPSIFGASRSERQETKLKPYFVPERSFSAFQRQFSGLSDSKASSVPDTESVSSDLDNKDRTEEDEHSLEAEHEHVSHRRPFFVPEHVASDETGLSSFQRQSSEVSESKATESVSSENKDDNEEDEHSLEAEHASGLDEHGSDHVSHARPYFVPEHVAADETGFASFQRQLSEVSDSKVSSESDSESVSSAGDRENKDHIDLSQEPDLISFEDHEHPSGIIEHVSPVSESFEEDGNVDPSRPDEAEISVESATNLLHSSGSSLSSSDEASEQIYNLKEGNQVATRSVSESVTVTDQQELHSSGSSLSSSDEASEQIYNDKEGDEVAAGSVSETDYFLDRGSSIERFETDVTSLVVDESQPNEPVYDLSPRSVTRNLSSSSILMDLHKDESVQHNDDHNQSSSSASDAQNQVSAVPDYEEHVLADDNVPTSLQDKPVLEADEESLLDRSNDKSLTEDPEELQARDLEHGEVALPSSEAQITEVVHGEDISQQQEELPLLDTFVNEPSEDNTEVLQVQITSNNPDNLHIQELDVVEVADIETKAQEIPAYAASDTYSIESNNDDVDEIKEFDEDLLVELDAVGDFSVRDFGSTLNEMKDDPQTSEHVLDNTGITEEDSCNNDLESMNQDPHVSERDLETSHSVDEVSYSGDLGSAFDEMKQEYDIETKSSGDEDSESKDLGTALDERKQDPHVSDHDLEEMEHDPHASDRDLETKHSEEVKQDPRASDHDLETKHSEEMEQDSHASDRDLETKHSEEVEHDPHASDRDLETKQSEEMKQDPHDSNHDLETKHSGDDDSYSKDLEPTLDKMKQDLHALDHDHETKHSEDGDSYSKDATLNEMKQDPHDSSNDLETIDEDSYSKDFDTSFSEMKEDTHALEHRLETFYSVDENFYAKHVESAFNEMKHDLHASDQDFETNRSGDTKIKMDAEVVKSQNENDISNTKLEGAFQAEATRSKSASDADEAVLPQETESSTTVNHGTENASTSNTYKE
ncbi:hypothetical protein Hdeb2414_s0020g00560351 [Helianthus debilis subsp. tardiflorus]